MPPICPTALAPVLPLVCRLPSVTVTYQNLSVETDAAVGAAGIPTVARFLGGDLLASAQRALAGRNATSRTVRLPVLRNVQGVLKPVSSSVGEVSCAEVACASTGVGKQASSAM